MRYSAIFLLAAALALSGCGSTQSSSSENFRGAEADVADVVDELASAGRGKDPAKICGELLAPVLVERIEAGGLQCVDEISEAIDDADEYDLHVRDVTVSGNSARAQVRSGDDGPTATFEFTRERGGWRTSSFGN